MSYEEVVFKRSYINIILLNRSIPSYNYDMDKEDGERSSRKATATKKSSQMRDADFFMDFM